MRVVGNYDAVWNLYMRGFCMGKDKQEEICFANLLSGKGGKYAKMKLRDFHNSNRIMDWTESPDFLSVIDGKALAVEHFVVDQIYIENRSAERIVNERVWTTYELHHSALEEDRFNSEKACQDLGKEIQFALDQAAKFNYDTCLSQFERVFDNHARKIPSYVENLRKYEEKKIYFLIEFNSWFTEKYSGIVKCIAVRMDGGLVSLHGNGIIITTKMIDILKKQIGVLEGVILQSYYSLDLNMALRELIYLDLTSEENLEKSIKEQRIEIYKEYYLLAPKVNLKLDLK